jgi:hypothetical protein
MSKIGLIAFAVALLLNGSAYAGKIELTCSDNNSRIFGFWPPTPEFREIRKNTLGNTGCTLRGEEICQIIGVSISRMVRLSRSESD